MANPPRAQMASTSTHRRLFHIEAIEQCPAIEPTRRRRVDPLKSDTAALAVEVPESFPPSLFLPEPAAESTTLAQFVVAV